MSLVKILDVQSFSSFHARYIEICQYDSHIIDTLSFSEGAKVVSKNVIDFQLRPTSNFRANWWILMKPDAK